MKTVIIIPSRMAATRLKGKPLAQILGYQDFYDDKFLINDDVLIPRSETELILPEIIKYGDSISSNNSNFKIVDAGSGSGCIGLSLAKKRLKWNVICIENCFKRTVRVSSRWENCWLDLKPSRKKTKYK